MQNLLGCSRLESVKVGDYNPGEVDEFEKEINIKRVVQHENFTTMGLDYDICLVELQDSIELVPGHVEAVNITEVEADAGVMCTVAGWDSDHSSMMKIQYPMADCDLAYGDEMGPGMICAGYEAGGVGVCNGYIGSPLMCDNTHVAGLSSWGYGCAMPMSPDVFTSVAFYNQWIKDQLSSI